MEITSLTDAELEAAGGTNAGGVATGIAGIAIGVGMVLAPEVTIPALIIGLGTTFVGATTVGFNM
jgi:hypothetical protein